MAKKCAVIQQHYVWGSAVIVALLGVTWVTSLAVARQSFDIEVQTTGRAVRITLAVATPPVMDRPSDIPPTASQVCPLPE
ncbi:MAG: hypothetical protein AAF959_10955 [Cyanobacteria bacterium P01_D01_bin.56]